MEETSAIVIDNGASTIKAGFSCEDSPRALFSPIVGRPKYTDNKNTFGLSDVYIGDNIEARSRIIYTSNPIEAGYVKNWDDIEKVWEYTIYTELRVPPEEHPIILTETPLSSNKCRETTTQIMFEVFDAPYFYLINQCVPALYASGLTTGLACESGEEVTSIVPIYEGNTIYNSSNRILLAGKDVTKYLIKLLCERSVELSCTKEFTIAKNIKEKLCYIAEDFNTSLNESTPNYLYEEPYELPDGTSIKIKNERFRTPEILFQPQLAELNFKGIHDYIIDSIFKCDEDIRSDLFNRIVLAGGTTLFTGFKERILTELNQLYSSSYRICVLNPPERKFSTWIGLSILASLSVFEDKWITKSEYDEHGPRIVQRKCL